MLSDKVIANQTTIKASDYNKLRRDAYASSWLMPVPTTPESMQLEVHSGILQLSDGVYNFNQQLSPTFVNPSGVGLDRIDLLAFHLDTKNLVIHTGIEAVNPQPVLIPSGTFGVAEVYLKNGGSAIYDYDSTNLSEHFIYKDVRPLFTDLDIPATKEQGEAGTAKEPYITPLSLKSLVRKNTPGFWIAGSRETALSSRTIQWNPLVTSGTYKVYRKEHTSGSWELEYTCNQDTTEWIDTQYIEGDYDYKVEGHEDAYDVTYISTELRFLNCVNSIIPDGFFGNGEDGAFVDGSLIKGKIYQFTSFKLSTQITLGTGGNDTPGKLVVMVQGDLEINENGKIISNADQADKDNLPFSIGATDYYVTSSDGTWGVGGAGGSGGNELYGVRGANGGAGGSNGNAGTDGADGQGTGGVGGASGCPGQPGSSGTTYQDGGGGGGSGSSTNFQNGILFVVGGDILINGKIVAQGASGCNGGTGARGNNAYNTYDSGAGGGGGGAGSPGTGGKMVTFLYHGTVLSNELLHEAVGGNGSEGGLGGAGGTGGSDPSAGNGFGGGNGTDGEPGDPGIVTLTHV